MRFNSLLVIVKKMWGFVDKNKGFITIGLLLEISLIFFLIITGIHRGSYLLMVFFWLPFTIYILAIWWISRADKAILPKQGATIVLLFGFIFHVSMLSSSSPLSDDVYRYYWDGKVINNGFNPYSYSPDSPLVQHLRDPNWDCIQNRDVQTMYPPLSQIVFAAAFFIYPGTLTLRLFSVLFSLLSIYILILILKELGHDVRYSLIYAWSPLVAIEFANSGHIDSLAVLLTLLSFLFVIRGKISLSPVALALAVLSKVYPLLFAVLFFPRWRIKGILIFVAVIVTCYLPFLGAGGDLFQGFSFFIGWGIFNGSFFPLLLSGLQSMMGLFEALLISKVLVFIVFIGILAYLFFRLLQQEQTNLVLIKNSFWLTGAFLLLSPTVHPWYLIWVLPFLCFFRSAGWILLTGTVILARSVYIGYEATGAFKEVGWVRLLEYGPPFLLILYGSRNRFWGWKRESNKESQIKCLEKDSTLVAGLTTVQGATSSRGTQ